MIYEISDRHKQFLGESLQMLNEIEVKGGKNVSLMFGALNRLEEIIKSINEQDKKNQETKK